MAGRSTRSATVAAQHAETASAQSASDPLPAPTVASPPFDKKNTDVILRSSDRVDFYVRKGILSEVSGLFEDMFTLPQLPASRKRKERDDEDYVDDVPVVQMAESSEVIDTLLRFCYPIANPALNDLNLIFQLLEATRKFGMDVVGELVTAQATPYYEQHPYDVFAEAYARGWRKEMQEAAKASLLHAAPSKNTTALKNISVAQFFWLQEYHERCWKAGRRTMFPRYRGEPLITFEVSNEWVFVACKHRKAGQAYGDERSALTTLTSKVSVQDWFIEALCEMTSALEARPRGATLTGAALIARCAMPGVKRCSECARFVVPDLMQFAERYGAQVEEAISKVKIFSVSAMDDIDTHPADRASDGVIRMKLRRRCRARFRNRDTVLCVILAKN